MDVMIGSPSSGSSREKQPHPIPAKKDASMNTADTEQPRAIMRWGFGLIVAAYLVQWAVIWSVQFPGTGDALTYLARHYLESQYLFGNPLPPYYDLLSDSSRTSAAT